MWNLIGHDWAVEHLHKGLIHNRLRHAYLIIGVESVGKSTLAHAFAQALNCEQADPAMRPCGACRSCLKIVSGNHPDIVYTETDANTGALRIEAIREVASRLALKPFEGRNRVAILHDFDHAQDRAQDALLKTLEEPPPRAVLILLATSIDRVLPTIRSRSQMIHLRAASIATVESALIDRYGAEPNTAALLARVSGGRVGWALRALHDGESLQARSAELDQLERLLASGVAERFAAADELAKDKGALASVLSLWLSYWRDVLRARAAIDSGEPSGDALAPAHIDHADAIGRLAERLPIEAIAGAMAATRGLLDTIARGHNANWRLAVEVLLLRYPAAG